MTITRTQETLIIGGAWVLYAATGVALAAISEMSDWSRSMNLVIGWVYGAITIAVIAFPFVWDRTVPLNGGEMTITRKQDTLLIVGMCVVTCAAMAALAWMSDLPFSLAFVPLFPLGLLLLGGFLRWSDDADDR
jgi:hypothetical protein